jgi:LysR family glycine cleavage system transcriptional activator
MASSNRPLPLNALRSFDAAARHLSFALAAEELCVTPAAISVQVRRLEEWVGAPLFLRGHRSVTLSTTGEALAPRLTALFVEMERLLGQVAKVHEGSLQVSAMPSFASKWVAPRLAGFRALHPHIQVRVMGSDRRADFERDGIDIGLRYGDGTYPDLHCELIVQAAATPVCSPELAARIAGDPARIDTALLLHDESALVAPGLPTWSAWFAQAGAPRDIGGEGMLFSNSHMALSAAVAGQGFALGLTPLIDDDVAAGRLVRPFPIQIESSFGFWFVCARERVTEPKIAAFRNWVFAEIGRR